MTPEQWIRKQQALIKNADKCFSKAVVSTHAEQTQRIFSEGLDASGQPIGNYDTKSDLYVNPNKAVKSFPPAGKYGDTVFKNGKPHKTGYFDNYKAFRSKQGRGSNKVDLNYSGVLFRDYASSLSPNGNGFVSGVKNNVNVGKLNGAIEKYGAGVFRLSTEELSTLTKTFTKCLVQ
jgi:hypothetical protein